MGWTSFEAREASSKIEFEEILSGIDRQRRAGKVFWYLYRKGIDRHTMEEAYSGLRSKYFSTIEETNQPKMIKKTVKEAGRTQWDNRMQAKAAFELYR